MLDGAEEADREEFTRLLAGYVEEHPAELRVMTRLGTGR